MHSIRWWAEFSDSRQFHLYLNMDPVVKLLTHYIDLNSKWNCFRRFGYLFIKSLNAQCIHDISHIV